MASALALPAQARQRLGPIGAALLVTLIAFAALSLTFGADPYATAQTLWRGVVGSPFTVGQTVMLASVLALTGLAALIPFSAKLWNVGGEGQLYMGGVAGVSTALLLPTTPSPVVLPAALLAGAAGGALWALIPGVLRAAVGASEMITSLLLNFVAIFATSLLITQVFPDSSGQGTRLVSSEARLPVLWPQGAVTIGLLIAAAAVLATWVVMRHTRLGFAIRAVGSNTRAARGAGFRTGWLTVTTFGLAGACAGLAGTVLVLGPAGQLTTGMSGNYGFLGVAVALVAGLRAAWVPLSALLFAALTVGSNSLQAGAGLPRDLGTVLVAVLLVALLATGALRLRR